MAGRSGRVPSDGAVHGKSSVQTEIITSFYHKRTGSSDSVLFVYSHAVFLPLIVRHNNGSCFVQKNSIPRQKDSGDSEDDKDYTDLFDHYILNPFLKSLRTYHKTPSGILRKVLSSRYPPRDVQYIRPDRSATLFRPCR